MALLSDDRVVGVDVLLDEEGDETTDLLEAVQGVTAAVTVQVAKREKTVYILFQIPGRATTH